MAGSGFEMEEGEVDVSLKVWRKPRLKRGCGDYLGLSVSRIKWDKGEEEEGRLGPAFRRR